MQTLEQLSRRIRTAEELLSVVRTMKSLAAANLRECERAAESLRLMTSTVETGFRMLLRLDPSVRWRPSGAAPAASLLVLVGSDHGMVGRFNEEVLEHAFGRLLAGRAREPGHVIAVGARLAGFAEDAGIRVAAVIDQPGSVEGIVRRVQEILPLLEPWIEAGEGSQVLLAHQRPKQPASCEPTGRVLLPIDAAWLDALARQPWPHEGLPWFSMPAPRLLGALVRQHLLVALHGALAESLAAEHAKRLATMQAADRNVGERLDRLTALHHRQRQSVTTAEILEVTSGFRVLQEEARGA